MKRAAVWDGWASALPWEGRWVVQTWDGEWGDGPHVDPHWSIEDCPTYTAHRFSTHAEALAYALSEVDLAPKEQS